MKWLRPVLPAGAILMCALGWLAEAPAEAAEENVVSVEPARILVAPEGSFTVHIRTDPPDETLAVWIVEVAFDPDVLAAASQDCNPFDPPGGSTGIAECQVVDTDGDGAVDTAKILGAVLFNRSGLGLADEISLADITFDAVGGPTECSDLRVRTIAFTDPDANETGALVTDGRVCVGGDAPASGTAEPTIVEPRTSEPTPEGGGETSPPIDVTDPAPGQTDDAGNTFPPGDTDVPGASGQTNPPDSGDDDSPSEGVTADPTEPDSTDDDGGSAALWVILGVGVLGAAAAGAWALVRLRKPPEAPSP